MSPTERTLKWARAQGWIPWVVERRVGPATVDLYNIIDLVVLDDEPGLMGMQVTSGSNHAARRKKALANEFLPDWLRRSLRFEVVSWHKSARTGKWVVRREPITADDFIQ